MAQPIVLLQPPFFRCVGSHNDRAPLELAYVSRFLDDANVDHVVVNADYSGSSQHLPWRALFDREAYLRSAADGDSPVLDECVELVMQHHPEMVVVAAGDSCIPTKDVGSPYIAAQVSQRLRGYGVRTIGLGPMFVKDAAPFAGHFDSFFRSLANRSIVDLLVGETPDEISGTPLGSEPLFSHVQPWHSTNYVMSSFGCMCNCSYCMAPLMTAGRMAFQPTGVFVRDLLSRALLLKTNRLYVADMIFPVNIRRLHILADALDGAGLSLVCESRTDTIRPEALGALRKMGVETVKIGIEAVDDETLKTLRKRQTVEQEEAAVAALRAQGFRVVAYLIFGAFYSSVAAMHATLDRAETLDVDYFVVNVAAYESFGWDDRRYDSHFSRISARRQGVPDAVLDRALELQEANVNPTVTTVVEADAELKGVR